MSERQVAGAGVATPVFWGSLSFVFLNFGLPVYTRQLGADAVAIGGMFTVFTFTMLIVRPLVGWGLDRYGRRWLFTTSFVFYTLAMWAFSGADGLVDFYVARFLQGLGASFMWVTARTIVADTTDVGTRAEEMGRLQQRSVQASMMGAFYGFTLLGMMPLADAWRLGFAGYAAAAVVGLLVSMRVPETRRPVGASTVALELGVDVKRLLVVMFLTGFATALIEPIYLIYLQDKFELPMVVIAMAFFPAGIVFAVLPRHAGRWADRYGRAPLMTIGLVAAALVAASLPWFPHILWIAVFYTLYSAGWALASPAQTALLGDFSDDATRGRLFGYSEAASSFGAALGPLIGGFIYEHARAELAFAADGAILLVGAALVWSWFKSGSTESRDDHTET